MNDWRVRRNGSLVYPAFRWRARAYRAALRAWVTVGGARLSHAVHPRREGRWPLGDLLSPDVPSLSSAAVSMGIPGPGQKSTARLMDERGRVLGFAKYAESPYARGLAANEARMLEVLPEDLGPRLVRFTPFLEGDLLLQTVLPGRTRVPLLRLDAAQVRFFQRLVQPGTTYRVHEHPYVAALRARPGTLAGAFDATLEALGGEEWPVAWMHGDMAPWNLHFWRGEYRAFDWEHGSETGFPYLDAAATLIQVATIIRRMDPARAKRVVTEELKAGLPARYAGYAPALATLSALNMLASWYPPRPPDANKEWLERFAENR